MAIRSFDVGGQRGLVRAYASDVPNLMVITGTNGAGKSTLLDSLRRVQPPHVEPGTRVMFVGAHRTWRGSQVNRANAYGFNFDSFADLLAIEQIPGFQFATPQGLQGLINVRRDSGGSDDSPAFIKTTLVRLLDKQMAILHRKWQEGRAIGPEDIPDLFSPLSELVDELLPHLEWVRVDASNDKDIRCLFAPRGNRELTFDIDQLSSGEKSVISLLLPFVERQAEALASGVVSGQTATTPTVLLDEPELHLHPLLQLQLLEYLRVRASRGEAQFIVATHSTTMLDALRDDELWLLNPPVQSRDNQLSRLSNDFERLEAARGLTGSTNLLTRAKPVVFVEGERLSRTTTPDVQLIRRLVPETRAWAIVPSGDRAAVIRAVERMRESQLSLPGMPAFGIVDGDSMAEHPSDRVLAWPVSSIENLLIDPESVSIGLLQALDEAAPDVAAVRVALEAVLASHEAEEIRIRFHRMCPTLRIDTYRQDPSAIHQEVAVNLEQLLEGVRARDFGAMRDEVRSEVKRIALDFDMAIRQFHGKSLLEGLYRKLGMQSAGVSKAIFRQLLASGAASSGYGARIAGPVVAKISLFVPADLGGTLSEVPEGQRDAAFHELLAKVIWHRQQWEAGEPHGEGRHELRRMLFDVAGRVPSLRDSLTRVATEFAVPG